MRISTLASMVAAGVAAVTAVLALWMKLADKQRDLLARLSVWSAVAAGVGFVAVVGGKLAEGRAARVRHDAQWRATVGQLLRECPDGALPRLSALSNAVLGATPTRCTAEELAPYVPRPGTDRRLADLLTRVGPPFEFVVVVGASKAGKSRTAAHAARQAWDGRDLQVLLPMDGEALAKLMRLEPPLPLAVPTPVWLDDLTAADLSHLTSDVLDAVGRRGWLVATMTEERWNQICNSSGDITRTARVALGRAVRVPLDFELTESELTEARRLYPAETMTASIAETLVGAQWLLDKYRAGRSDQPAGCAVVQAAVDARRAGLSRPIPAEYLLRLFPLYLRRIRIDLEPTTALFEEGLAWAKQPVASQVALIAGTPAGYQVFDYIVATDDGQEGHPPRPVLGSLWTELVSVVHPIDAYDIGVVAYLRDNRQAAIAAMRKRKVSTFSGRVVQGFVD
ncbi:hypothetical protein ACWD6N_36810 [Micromonospora sp. NPDC005163]